MKKVLKSRIFLVIITMLVSVGTTVCGAILYNANQVSYTPSDTTWNVSNVDEALNDLYNTANTKFTNFKSTIATAITDMGVTTTEDADADTMANNIKSLVTFKSTVITYAGTSATLDKDYDNAIIIINDVTNNNYSLSATTTSGTLKPLFSDCDKRQVTGSLYNGVNLVCYNLVNAKKDGVITISAPDAYCLLLHIIEIT